MRKTIGIIAVVFLMLQCGCVSSRNYFVDRGVDAADIFTATVGIGAEAKARVGPLMLGVGYFRDYSGLRAGDYGNLRKKSIVHRDILQGELCLPLYCSGDTFATDMTHIRNKSIYLRSPAIPILCCPFLETALPFTQIQEEEHKNPANLTQIEVVAACVFGLRLGFNPGELLDFVLGWFTIDIYGDDLSVAKKKKEIEALRQQEIRKRTREIERKTKESERISKINEIKHKKMERASNIRLGKSTFVLQDGQAEVVKSIYVNLPSSVCEIDLLQRYRTIGLAKYRDKRSKDEAARFQELLQVDLKLSLKYDPKSVTCEVIFEMPAKMQGGFFKANNSLNMMPQNGYQREPISVTVGSYATQEKIFFIYVKSREPSIYTRVAFDICIQKESEWSDDPTRLVIQYEPCINPYGDRNINPVWNLPRSVSKKLEKDAREALASGRHAEKPDLIKLIEEATQK